MRKKTDIDQISDRILLLNLYISQFVILAIGMLIMLLWQHRSFAELKLWSEPIGMNGVIWGGAFAAVVLLLDVAMMKWLPNILDDGGLNEKIFLARPIWRIALICLVVSACEEFLFRGVIQHSIGPYWTSIIFTAIHFRYLKHWFLTGLVFLISYGLGWIYIYSGSLWTPVIAHFTIDFVLGCIIRWKGVQRAS